MSLSKLCNQRQFFSHDVELNNKGILHFTFTYLVGSYRHRFVEIGTFYYWSGPINAKDFTMRGVVHVVKKNSYVEPLSYKVGTIEPTYEKPSE